MTKRIQKGVPKKPSHMLLNHQIYVRLRQYEWEAMHKAMKERRFKKQSKFIRTLIRHASGLDRGSDV